ncbi:hypothetical protein [Limnospira platensis]|uniref:hypothetical protein n=1 Tax=Limnospira platensis TaxID=118562 RepID=UPI0001D0EF3A|nr:hypothetical protein [Arthrospira platensis]MDF2208953.1 hypothetical protein [Arthrospira platensis NCB002]MDT9298244.1 hypothetical protein [Arthrospira platensis PCC 7345]QQW29355.1 hypothetical protein AP9108_32350 [Arthrospira sp. PCC 9108]BAI87851.1 hypothetical protein NIES39_A00100 [Arthrospira platensis NIES-39]
MRRIALSGKCVRVASECDVSPSLSEVRSPTFSEVRSRSVPARSIAYPLGSAIA